VLQISDGTVILKILGRLFVTSETSSSPRRCYGEDALVARDRVARRRRRKTSVRTMKERASRLGTK
jgi:hypothetical protein